MNIDYEKMLWDFIGVSEKLLNINALTEIIHFYNHDEYEMALEGLLIVLIRSGISPDNFDMNKLKSMVIHYGLNKESIFDELIWDKFFNWR